jgi:pentatricopeptide repeat protein
MYAKSGHTTEASNVFYKMGEKNVVSWNAMVANYAQNRLELAAIGLIAQMQAHGQTPNSVTFTNVLPACARDWVLFVLEKKSLQGQFEWDLPMIYLFIML